MYHNLCFEANDKVKCTHVHPCTPQFYYMSRHMGKPTICIGENKGADQLRSNCEYHLQLNTFFWNALTLLRSEFPVFKLIT